MSCKTDYVMKTRAGEGQGIFVIYSSQLLLAQNNSFAKVSYFRVVYFGTIHG